MMSETEDWAFWDKHAEQFPLRSEPGIEATERRTHSTVVDILLNYDTDGRLQGIFYHYNPGNIFCPPGSCHCVVRPDRRRQQVASDLLREADKRWVIEEKNQRYTGDGNAFVEGLIAKGKIDQGRTTSLEGLPDSISGRRASERQHP